jgi:hypothetical protein
MKINGINLHSTFRGEIQLSKRCDTVGGMTKYKGSNDRAGGRRSGSRKAWLQAKASAFAVLRRDGVSPLPLCHRSPNSQQIGGAVGIKVVQWRAAIHFVHRYSPMFTRIHRYSPDLRKIILNHRGTGVRPPETRRRAKPWVSRSVRLCQALSDHRIIKTVLAYGHPPSPKATARQASRQRPFYPGKSDLIRPKKFKNMKQVLAYGHDVTYGAGHAAGGELEPTHVGCYKLWGAGALTGCPPFIPVISGPFQKNYFVRAAQAAAGR